MESLLEDGVVLGADGNRALTAAAHAHATTGSGDDKPRVCGVAINLSSRLQFLALAAGCVFKEQRTALPFPCLPFRCFAPRLGLVLTVLTVYVAWQVAGDGHVVRSAARGGLQVRLVLE